MRRAKHVFRAPPAGNRTVMPSTQKEAAIALGGAAATVAQDAIRSLIARRDSDGNPRAYRLKRREPVPDAVRRIALGRLDDAIEQLWGETDSDEAKAVHEARKDLKKVRSLLRLVREPLGEDLYSLESTYYRDAGRQLSGLRDAEVMQQTLGDVGEGNGDLLERVTWLQRSLRSGQEEAAGEARERMAAVAGRLEAGRERIADWPLEGEGWELLEGGVRRSYRRGRNRFAEAEQDPTAERLHEWRKRVKDLWYHTRLLRGADREMIGGLADQLDRLSDQLGDEHDLVVLEAKAHERPADGARREGLTDLLRAIERRRGELQYTAFMLGRPLYSRKPKAFAKALGKRWQAWS
jgi:CHAD domain-containing protein